MSLPKKLLPQPQNKHFDSGHPCPSPYTIFPCIGIESYSKIYDCSNVSALHVVTSIDTAVHRFNSNEHSFECVYDEMKTLIEFQTSLFLNY